MDAAPWRSAIPEACVGSDRTALIAAPPPASFPGVVPTRVAPIARHALSVAPGACLGRSPRARASNVLAWRPVQETRHQPEERPRQISSRARRSHRRRGGGPHPDGMPRVHADADRLWHDKG
jgi:hypothetical protein